MQMNLRFQIFQSVLKGGCKIKDRDTIVLLEGDLGKPSDELSDPKPWRGYRGTPLEKIETTLFKFPEQNTNFYFFAEKSLLIDFIGKSTVGIYKSKKPNLPKATVEL